MSLRDGILALVLLGSGVPATVAAVPVGPPFVINERSGGDQLAPDLALAPDGRMAVAFTDASGFDGSGWGAAFRLFDAAGAPSTGDVVAPEIVTGDQVAAQVAWGADGRLLVAWTDWGFMHGADGDQGGIHARLFDGTGAPASPQVQVNAASAGNQRLLALEAAPGGGFVVVFESNGGGVVSLLARRLDSDGVPFGSDAVIASPHVLGGSAAILALPAGEILLAWTWPAIELRRFDAALVPVAPQQALLPIDGPFLSSVALAMQADGSLLVGWSSSIDDHYTESFGVQRLASGSAAPIGLPVALGDRVVSDGNRGSRISVAASCDGGWLAACTLRWTSSTAGSGRIGFYEIALDLGSVTGPTTPATLPDGWETHAAVGSWGAGGHVIAWSANRGPIAGTEIMARLYECGCAPLSASIDSVLPAAAACAGTTFTLAGSASGGDGAILLEWDPDHDGSFDVIGTGASFATTYEVPGDHEVALRATDACGAPSGPQEAWDFVTLTVHPRPSPSITGPATRCSNEPCSELDAGPGWSRVTWDSGESTQAICVAPAATTLHGVTVVDALGCEGTAQHLLEVLPAPAPVITERCVAGSIVLDAGPGWASTRWSTGDTTAEIDVGDGSRCPCSVIVTDASGCSAGASLDPTLDCRLPGEVSDVVSGAPPLLMAKPAHVSFELIPGATAYNAYVDAIGTWDSPDEPEGSACSIRTWTDRGDGTVAITFDIPLNSWLVISASNANAEGPAGRASDGRERSQRGPWVTCGPAP